MKKNNKDNILLSILIPVYNNAEGIEKCVMSALDQDYDEKYEVIVVDNCSTDGTFDILKRIKNEHLVVHRNAYTVSMYENHNVCLSYANSDYVVFLHADDELFPETLKIMKWHIERRLYPKRYILFGHSMFRDATEWVKSRVPHTQYNCVFSGETAKKAFINGGAPQPTGTCFSRKALLDIGGFLGLPKTAPEDWYIALWAAFNYFEFEMSDRLLFKREFSSSWGNSVKQSVRKEMILMVVKAMYAKFSSEQKEEIYEYWKGGNCTYWDEIFVDKKKKESTNQFSNIYKKIISISKKL